jgi:preprotein translocase subunit SecG
MEALRYILIVVEVICSLCLIGLVLIQKSKSEGLGMAFGSGMGENLFGSRAGNVLTKMTVIFGVVFMVNTVVLTVVYAGARERSLMSVVPVESIPATEVADTPAQVPVEGSVPPPAAPVGVPTLPGADLGDAEVAPVAVEVEAGPVEDLAEDPPAGDQE